MSAIPTNRSVKIKQVAQLTIPKCPGATSTFLATTSATCVTENRVPWHTLPKKARIQHDLARIRRSSAVSAQPSRWQLTSGLRTLWQLRRRVGSCVLSKRSLLTGSRDLENFHQQHSYLEEYELWLLVNWLTTCHTQGVKDMLYGHGKLSNP